MPVARFLYEFVKSPRTIGAIAPSTRFLGKRMVEGVDLGAVDAVAEYGPGTGIFTRGILRALRPGARYLGLEINDHWVRHLRRRFPDATILHDSAANVRRHMREQDVERLDAVFCSLPWSVFPDSLQDEIMGETIAALKVGGTFHTFMYVHAQKLPGGVRMVRRLERSFDRIERTSVAWLNVPPAFVFRCTKEADR